MLIMKTLIKEIMYPTNLCSGKKKTHLVLNMITIFHFHEKNSSDNITIFRENEK